MSRGTWRNVVVWGGCAPLNAVPESVGGVSVPRNVEPVVPRFRGTRWVGCGRGWVDPGRQVGCSAERGGSARWCWCSAERGGSGRLGGAGVPRNAVGPAAASALVWVLRSRGASSLQVSHWPPGAMRVARTAPRGSGARLRRPRCTRFVPARMLLVRMRPAGCAPGPRASARVLWARMRPERPARHPAPDPATSPERQPTRPAHPAGTSGRSARRARSRRVARRGSPSAASRHPAGDGPTRCRGWTPPVRVTAPSMHPTAADTL